MPDDENLFVGHDELEGTTFRAVFQKPGVTRATPEEERTFSLSYGETLARLIELECANKPRKEVRRALETWPAAEQKQKDLTKR